MKIGALNVYHFDQSNPQYQLAYSKLYINFLQKTLPAAQIQEYKVALGQMPASIYECDAWVISGSPKDAYGPEAWLNELKMFINHANNNKIKLLGICFGHQLISHALGGEVKKADVGWGIGVRSFRVHKFKSWMTPQKTNCSLIFSHQDQVTKLPAQACLLASDDFCPIQMFAVQDHIFCMQGHPEFTPEFAKERYDSRISKLGQNNYYQAIKSLQNETDAKLISGWIRLFLTN